MSSETLEKKTAPGRQRGKWGLVGMAAVLATSAGGAWAGDAAPQASTVPFQGRIKMTQYRGQWSANQSYRKGQVVFYGDQSWIALRNNINRGSSLPIPPAPQNTNWSLFSALGPVGPQGVTGAPGAAGPQGPAGASDAAGPQGPAGAPGAVGPQGPAGAPGAVGPQGANGAQGPQGSIGPSGTSNGVYKATVEWTATNPSWDVPTDLPSPKYLATITGTLNWTASGKFMNSNVATCTVIGLKGLGTNGNNQWVKRPVLVGWDYNTLGNVPTSWPTVGTAPISFTGFVDGEVTTKISLECSLTVDEVSNRTPNSSFAEISLVNLDTVTAMP
ncbi:MAG: hypothetical protein ACKN9W_10800 [Methylococcus sp.]